MPINKKKLRSEEEGPEYPAELTVYGADGIVEDERPVKVGFDIFEADESLIFDIMFGEEGRWQKAEVKLGAQAAHKLAYSLLMAANGLGSKE